MTLKILNKKFLKFYDKKRFSAWTKHQKIFQSCIDYKYIRDNEEEIKSICLKRNCKTSFDNVSRIINLYETYLGYIKLRDNLLNQRRSLTNSIKQEISSGNDVLQQEFIRSASELKKDIQKVKENIHFTQSELLQLVLTIPNNIHPLSPIGSEEKAKIMKYINSDKQFFISKPKDHIVIANMLGLIDFDAATKTSGHAFYFLKNEAALMEIALINYVLEKAINAGWEFVIPPTIVRSEVVSACGFQPRDDYNDTQIYFLESPNTELKYCLSGTSEIPIAGMEINKILKGSDLPKKVVGISRVYRSEAGSRGKKSKGLYRVHEFTKAELFAWSDPKNSDQILEDILKLEENIIEELGLYGRILDMPTFELGASAYRKYDIEVWMPGRGIWGEVTSCSNCTDYQTRRLNTRYMAYPGDKLSWPHTLNGTLAAIPRLIIAILETYQNHDGSIRIPKVLQKYMGGMMNIAVKKKT
ncbi:serine-tRNA ligase [Pneumocystis carinii B80]|uniref:serine--tRNA ligase n=1 Tax=Pneumocystis carinii (strain B80) TaxID=1408658 RepID=A0A0W4ZB86_PNEC8|nr:serine-tRNA ligase [Pneumocystis carinii B80]KTW25679.1 serine-tRNA ligase [Pneumocystis carinii B80]